MATIEKSYPTNDGAFAVHSQTDKHDQYLSLLLQNQRRAYQSDTMPSALARIDRLAQLKEMLITNQEQLIDSLISDYSARARDEILITEFLSSIKNIQYLSRHLYKWMQPNKRKVPLYLQPGRAKVVYQPLGVVGVMVPFNYPVFLTISPLASALAAGNRVMIKLPEATPATSELISTLLSRTFDKDLVCTTCGDVKVGQSFASLPFDHLLFTGSGRVGREVMRAASANLTPVTLELGGKSPVIVDRDTDLEEAASRICFAKSINAGQTCVAPDYLLVPEEKQDDFITAYQKVFTQFYPTVSDNQDYPAVISQKQLDRLQEFEQEAKCKGANIIPLSKEFIVDGPRKYVAKLLTNVDDSMAVMQQEIFGPLLPILSYKSIDDAIEYINRHDRPLALYYFGYNKEHQHQILTHTHSGSVAFNECMTQVAVCDLPFGGIGPSGMGQYHGREGFLTFSKSKSVLTKSKINFASLFYPPYGGRLMSWIVKYLLK